MDKIYKAVGGRKMFIFYLVFQLNFILALLNRFNENFGYFSIGLVGVLVVGNVGAKFASPKGEG